ncbi:MAG: hypothetical protein PSW75_06885 [bacterium]|nr:hypothetical protein [bacterium]
MESQVRSAKCRARRSRHPGRTVTDLHQLLTADYIDRPANLTPIQLTERMVFPLRPAKMPAAA